MVQLPRFGKHLSLTRVEPLLARAKATTATLVARKDELKEGMPASQLGELIALYETLSRSLSLAGELSHALFSINTQDDAARTMQQTMSRVSTELSTQVLFFSLTIKTWKKESLESYAKALPRFAAWLVELALYAPYTKSEPEERIIVLKGQTGSSTLEKLYTMITSDFTYSMTVDGKKKKLTRGELQAFYSHKDRAVRKEAMDALVVPFEKQKAILGELYHAIATEYDTETVTIRGHASPIDARHLGNNISGATYTALFTSYRKNVKVFQRYLKVKQHLLGYPDFTRYDFLAPIDGAPEHITYDDAYSTVIDAFEGFAPWLASNAKKIFAEGNVDVPPKKGKRDGACCYPMVPGETPLIILNFVGKYDDMFTMAHELGHAVHDLLADNLSPLTASPPLVLAESASTFAETVLFHSVLKKLSGQEAIAMICQRLDDCLGTIPHQLRYTAFEQQAHDHLKAGGAVRDLDALWVKLVKEDFPDITFPETSVQWSGIPHFFHSPFYCYSYAFGLLLVHALWKQYEKEGEAFVPKFKAILAAGGSVPPEELLARYGFDVTKEQFWDDGFAAISELVDELEKRSSAK